MSEQLDLLAADVTSPTPGRVHRHGLVTERKAAERVSFRSGSQKSRLLVLLAERGEATPHDLYALAGCAYPHVATTRLGDLAELHLVERLAETRPTPTGDTAHLWRCTEQGHAQALELRGVA